MKTLSLMLSLSFLSLPNLVQADTTTFDKAMSPLLAQYATIHKALAGDTSKGVARAAKMITKLAARLRTKSVTGKHAAHYTHLPMKIKTAAKELAVAKGLDAQRKAFMALSRPLAMWATMSKPAGISVVFCSMAKGSWLQKGKTIANPYYGAKMLRCGEVVGGKHKGAAGGHMKHGHGHNH